MLIAVGSSQDAPLRAISQEAGGRNDGCRRAPQGATGIAQKLAQDSPD
jgi:hypothetical protein